MAQGWRLLKNGCKQQLLGGENHRGTLGTLQMGRGAGCATLKIVPAPLVIEAVPKAPPVLEALNPTVECKCGNCGTILMRGDESKNYPIMILCISCGSYNSTDA
jgi:hypothetical protein